MHHHHHHLTHHADWLGTKTVRLLDTPATYTAPPGRHMTQCTATVWTTSVSLATTHYTLHTYVHSIQGVPEKKVKIMSGTFDLRMLYIYIIFFKLHNTHLQRVRITQSYHFYLPSRFILTCSKKFNIIKLTNCKQCPIADISFTCKFLYRFIRNIILGKFPIMLYFRNGYFKVKEGNCI